MFFLPTRNHPQQLAEIFQLYQQLNFSDNVIVIIDSDDFSYRGMEFPAFCTVEIVPPSTGASCYYDFMMFKYPNEEFYCNISDDGFLKTPEFDKKIREYLKIKPMVILKDNYCSPFGGFCAFTNRMAHIVKLNPSKSNHFFNDTIHFMFGLGNNCAIFAPDIEIDHRQLKLIGKTDETAQRIREPKLYQASARNFYEYINSKEFDEANFALRREYKLEIPFGIPRFNDEMQQKYKLGTLGTELQTSVPFDLMQQPYYAKAINDGVQFTRDMFYRDPL